MNFIYASCFYQFAVKKFTSSNSLTFTKPFATLEYNGGERKLTKPAYYFKSSNDFAISKNITAYLDFIYNDLGEILLERKESMYNLSCGLICSFMDNRLFLNISANDILDTYNFKDYRNYGYYDVVHEYLPDNTYVRIDLKYVILSGKQIFKVKNNNSSTMSRF